MWVMRLNIVDCGYFKIQTLQEILKTQKINIRRSFVHYRKSNICSDQTSVSHSSTESEIIPLDDGLRIGWFTCARLVEACTRETGVKTQITPKIEQLLDENVDLSNIDQVLSNAHLSEKESQLYIFEDNKAVIKMIIKGRSPTMRHVSRTLRVALDWFFVRTNLDPKVQISVSNPKTNSRSFTRVEGQNLLHFYNI